MKRLVILTLIALIYGCVDKSKMTGATEITRWQYGKTAAVSLTYDDGSRKQFSQALPIMKRLNLPATFFIITGAIPGSYYPPAFVGRPVEKIIRETATTSTNEDNFFERISAARYLGYKGALAYYDKADGLYESGKKAEAYLVTDTLYNKVRSKILKPGKDTSMEISQEKGLTWEYVRNQVAEGYEFASHTVTHAHLAVLDTANILYELEKSREDIRRHLGDKYTFSAEVPFGIEDKRVMKYAFRVYPALRNLMPEPFMKEINRGNKAQPGISDKEYVQWQRGPLSQTAPALMKSWIDTTLSHDNIWLVLVFHGVDDVGWEAIPHERLDDYFQYIKAREDKLWIATFGDVARYIRERMSAKVQAHEEQDKIMVNLEHSLDTAVYNIPLTLKTYVREDWKKVQVRQGNKAGSYAARQDKEGTYVLYQARPNAGVIELSKGQ